MKKLKQIFFVLFLHAAIVFIKGVGLFYSRKFQNNRSDKILYLAAFFPNNAGYIYRVEKWAEMMKDGGFEVDIKFTLTEKEYKSYLHGKKVNAIGFYRKSLIRRIKQLLSVRNYGTIIVRRELLLFNDYGDLFLEKFILKVHPHVILDFDDDISFSKGEPKDVTSLYSKLLMESSNKFSDSLKLYQKFIVGSSYLKGYVLNANKGIEESEINVIPTCVDYEKYPVKKYLKNVPKKITFCWVGTNGNLKLLNNITKHLNEVNKIHPLKLIVISGLKFKTNVDYEIENIQWSYDSQIDNLMKADIGLMPLNNKLEDKGKCGFKLLQYMGLGIVSIASGVTVNKEIVENDVNGYLVSPEENNWTEVILKAIANYDNFVEVGMKARRSVEDRYTFESNKLKYISFVNKR